MQELCKLLLKVEREIMVNIDVSFFVPGSCIIKRFMAETNEDLSTTEKLDCHKISVPNCIK